MASPFVFYKLRRFLIISEVCILRKGLEMSDLKPQGIKPLKVWFDENGERHMKFDRKELTEFVQANPNVMLAPVIDDEGKQIGFIPPHALSVYLQF